MNEYVHYIAKTVRVHSAVPEPALAPASHAYVPRNRHVRAPVEFRFKLGILGYFGVAPASHPVTRREFLPGFFDQPVPFWPLRQMKIKDAAEYGLIVIIGAFTLLFVLAFYYDLQYDCQHNRMSLKPLSYLCPYLFKQNPA